MTMSDDWNDDDDNVDFLSYIFNVSENTKIIHLIMVIWLSSFIMSSFKLASGPPQDPGGSKRDIFKIKEMIHRIFSVKTNIEPVPKWVVKNIFVQCALFTTRRCVYSCQKIEKIGMNDVIGDGTRLRESTRTQFA